MSELQNYYNQICAGDWAVDDENECPCHGSGWMLSDLDTTHQCPIHYKGQLDHYSLSDMPVEEFEEENKRAMAQWAAEKERRKQAQLDREKNKGVEKDDCPF